MIDQIRQDTDLSAGLIHLNNAGASLPPSIVTDSIIGYLREEARRGGYETAARHQEDLDGFYRELGRYLNAPPERIAYAVSATDAFNRGLGGIDWRTGDLILTTKSDYVSNHLLFLRLRDRYGVQTEIIPEGASGFDPAALEARLEKGPRPRLVSITHIPTNSGRIQDVHAAGIICRKHDVLYAVDACQSAGQLPLDVEAIGCDFLTATFRKYLRGPRGVGFLYVSERVLDGDICPVGLDLRGADWPAPDRYDPQPDARRFELWEESKALKLGAARAAAYLNEIGIDFIQDRIAKLSMRLEVGLGRLDGVRLHPTGIDPVGASEKSLPLTPPLGLPGYATQTGVGGLTAPAKSKKIRSGIHLMSLPAWTKGPAALVRLLQEKGLNATTSGATHDQFHFREKGIDWALRLSPHYYNTEEEIDRAVEILEEVIA